MKNYSRLCLAIFLLALGLCKPADAQVHIKSIQGVGLEAGISDLGVQTSLNYVRFLHRNWYAQAGFDYQQGKVSVIGYRSYGAHLKINRSLYDVKESLFFSLGAELYAAMEQGTGIEVSRNKQPNRFAWGVGLGAEAEYYFSPKIAAVTNFYQMYQPGSGFGSAHYQASLGIRYFFH